MWKNYTIWMNPSSCIFGKTSAVRQFHFNSRFFFFILLPGFHLIVWKLVMVFRTISTWKTWKFWVVFPKQENKTWQIRLLDHRWCSWNAFLAAAALRLRPRGASRPAANAAARRRTEKCFMNTTYGPGAETFNLFDFRVSWNHQWFQVFMPK